MLARRIPRALAAARTSSVAPRLSQIRWASTDSAKPLRRTGLYNFHVENGAKMVPFAGYEMPLTYSGVGQVDSHKHVRSSVGLFDVGHMVQHYFRGAGATRFLEWLTPSDLNSLPNHSSTLSVLLLPSGGILDDTVVTKHTPDLYYVVTNAGRREEDLTWFASKLKEWNEKHGDKVEHQILEDWGLVALQGPKSADYLQGFVDTYDGKQYDLKQLTFGKSAWLSIGGVKVHVARGGYTGEDGFEISLPPSETVAWTRKLYKFPVQLAGLAARDSLRLEAGLCLYGNDLDESTSPVEAGLTWVIGKNRRTPGDDKASFIGADAVISQIEKGVSRKRVGFLVEGPPAREHAPLFAPSSSEQIGEVTSGIPSPSTGKNIAMGYIATKYSKRDTEVEVEVRGKRRKAKVTKMPFVPTNYWRGEGVLKQ
ncbi:Aminomethyltransferase, mitochondrial; AltName: Full=Glycine cleavage system T protein; Short=GCVT; AltName: Full=Glycine decarboxylase complex subunit T; Flags: Precursor [Serendipita indica DSM 11827]|uniref:Aminomethyltransferase n=1 Tax=Serendipita indica (strain DSM 11827) TaxID=1109443 RepID=G4TLM2_SERID|nr:Aminomethyltransferase, mitochondrial; AltName: Full=Glycine cleavage system T protein; Short=GCVT; AltName: Full=Glycine decarboxylase complex subunit T; Flags: Precursor [Serendipita indica DSM 11827]CCA72213.1 probable GCV1-glycine decarboxylase, subunit T, mitochondrial [Serendipita indica DSM 11827]